MKKLLFRLRINNIIILKFIFLYFILKSKDLFVYNLKNYIFLNVIKFIKNNIFTRFSYLVDVFTCDYIFYSSRFRLVYNFSSFNYKNNIFLNISLKLLTMFISLFTVFKASVWIEREIYDMFGIIFFNNWDLRKILTDYTFFGFPLRKDFPLSGFVEIFYDLRKKSIFETLIELMQELRFYINSSYIEFWDQETL